MLRYVFYLYPGTINNGYAINTAKEKLTITLLVKEGRNIETF